MTTKDKVENRKWGKIYCIKCGRLIGGHFLEEYGEYSDVIDEIYCKECYKKQLKIEIKPTTNKQII